MSLLKHVDRIALMSLLSVSLAVPAAALACSAATAAPNEANFRNITAGMSAAEVLARIGPPSSKMRFAATRTTAWDYRFTDAWTYDSEFSVIVDDRGIVVSRFIGRTGE
jgi:hypothetical protein